MHIYSKSEHGEKWGKMQVLGGGKKRHQLYLAVMQKQVSVWTYAFQVYLGSFSVYNKVKYDQCIRILTLI